MCVTKFDVTLLFPNITQTVKQWIQVKEAAYKGLVCPVLEYGSSVWDPPGVVLQEELESAKSRTQIRDR